MRDYSIEPKLVNRAHLDGASLSDELGRAESDSDSYHALSLHCARAWADAEGAAVWLSDRPFPWLGRHISKRTSVGSIHIDCHSAKVELVWEVNCCNVLLSGPMILSPQGSGLYKLTGLMKRAAVLF